MAKAAEIEQAIARVHDESSFVQELLAGALDWPIEGSASTVEDIAYEWSADELNAEGLDARVVDGVVKQIVLPGNPWGIFLLEFKDPEAFAPGRGMTGALRKVLRGLVPKKRANRDSRLAAFQRENLLFICSSDYERFRFAYFKTPPSASTTPPLTAFGWDRPEAIRTVCEHNLVELAWPDEPLSETQWVSQWSQAFDVEKVTRSFFADYARTFAGVEAIIGGANRIGPEELRMFTQVLFNRLMFLRFVERKGWLQLDGHREGYLRALWDKAQRHEAHFYESLLRPLFFEGLGSEAAEGTPAFGQVPFLGGGLFEEGDLDQAGLVVPNEAFPAITGDEGLFYRYNFTVEESTPLDIEVAVDPEMLGKVFEELVTGRHESGSYYTPRAVVTFMCREALKPLLLDRTGASQEAIEALVDHHVVDGLTESDAGEITAVLDVLRVVDPACGSGAYLLGFTQELLAVRRALQSEKLSSDSKFQYELKLRIISHTLYGVDLDPFATEIAKLRLWLTLAIESDSPVPLPNLDFRIESGDALIGPNPQDIPDLFRERLRHRADALAQMKEDYLLLVGAARRRCRKAINKEEEDLSHELKTSANDDAVDWRVHFAEVFATEGGFDLVITNPPYVRQELISHYKPRLKQVFPELYSGTADLYVYFYGRALELLRQNGVLAFIAPNKFFRAQYGEKLRKLLTSRSRILDLLDFGDSPVFEAVTYPAIIVAQKARSPGDHRVRTLRWVEGDAFDDIGDVFLRDSQLIPQESLTPDSWVILGRAIRSVLDRLMSMGQPLSTLLDGGLHYGIKTGRNSAFEIDEATRSRLVSEDPRSAEIIRPWLRGRDVGRWTVNWGGKYLIFARRGVDINSYPAVLNHLAQFRNILEPRPRNVSARGWKGRKPGSYKWYEIQDAVDYWEAFDRRKIVYQVIATYQQFAFTDDPFVSNDKTWIIPDPPPGLLSILNSKVVWFILDQLAPKLQGGAFELRSPYMAKIPIVQCPPRLIQIESSLLEAVASQDTSQLGRLESELEQIISEMYGLSTEEKRIIDDELARSGARFRPGSFRETHEYKTYVADILGLEE